MFLAETTLAVEVVLEESMVWLCWILTREKLLVSGYLHRWCLDLLSRSWIAINTDNYPVYLGYGTDLLHHTFLRADRESIIQLVLGEVDLWKGLLVPYLIYGLFNLFLSCTHACVSVECGGGNRDGDEWS